MKTEQAEKIKQITGQEEIPYVSAGVVAGENVSGHVISEDGLIKMVEAIEAGEAAQASATTLTQQLTDVNAQVITLTQANEDLQTQLATEKENAANAATQAASDLSTANTKIAELETKLQQGNQGFFSTPPSGGDSGIAADSDKDIMTDVDAEAAEQRDFFNPDKN